MDVGDGDEKLFGLAVVDAARDVLAVLDYGEAVGIYFASAHKPAAHEGPGGVGQSVDGEGLLESVL